MKKLRRYVALGDSQTEGLLDLDPRGGYRGWADRFAEFVAARDEGLQYANLAIRGKLVGEIRREQLDIALALEPDLVTVMGGLNDLLRPHVDVDVMLADLDAMLGAFGAATVLTNTFPDIAQVTPLLRRFAPRVQAYNAGIRVAAARHGALVVDFAGHGTGTDPRIWSADRIHANPIGHALMASAFADTLGLPGFAAWSDPLPPARPAGRTARATVELRWVGGTLLPWIGRRVRGRSSGDGITPKRPRLVPVSPMYHLIEPAGWAAASAAGVLRPASVDAEGFVHFSFAGQLAGSANRHYAAAAELTAVEFDPMSIDAEIRVEDSYGSGTAFPHAYGPVATDAAVAVHPMTRGPDGAWAVSRAGAAAAASPGR